MINRIKTILKYGLFISVGLFLVWWQLKSMTVAEKKEFTNAIANANYWVLIPISIMSLCSHISRSMRWKLLLEPMGYKPALPNLFMATMIGYLANSAIPRLGELLKCTFLARYEKLKLDKLVGTIILERSFDLICYVAFIGITVLFQLSTIGSYVQEKFNLLFSNNQSGIWIKISAVALFVLIVWIVARFLFKKFAHLSMVSKIRQAISGIFEGIKTIKTLKNPTAFWLHTLFIWTMYLAQIYVGFWGMGGTAELGIGAACSVLTLATLSMIVTPGGIGSFPIFVMQTLLIYGINEPLGKAFGWLMWGSSTIIILIAGLTSLIFIPFYNRNKEAEKAT
jgi:uncharacterized protein (TIRG00374 family)